MFVFTKRMISEHVLQGRILMALLNNNKVNIRKTDMS